MKDGFSKNSKNNYSGDNRLLPYLYYSKKDHNICVFCGKPANSREHIPPRCFIDSPFPDDWPILPSCKKCNNSFSNDEQFVSRLLEWIYCTKNNNGIFQRAKYKKNPNKLDLVAKKYKSINIDNIEIDNNDKIIILNLIYKLARCHLFYDCSMQIDRSSMDISFVFGHNCPSKWKKRFDSNTVMRMDILPEIGSRLFEKYCIIEDYNTKEFIPIVRWITFQEGRYRYLLNPSGFLLIVIRECLYAQIIF